MNLDFLLDYIRLVAYATIILSSLNGICKRKFNNVLFLGDIIMAFGLLLAGMHTNLFGKNGRFFADLFLTPSAIVWAVIHFLVMIKGTHLDKDNSKT